MTDTLDPPIGDIAEDSGAVLYCAEPGCEYHTSPDSQRPAAALARHRTRSHPDLPRDEHEVPQQGRPVTSLPGAPPGSGERPPQPSDPSKGRFWRGLRNRVRQGVGKAPVAGGATPPRPKPTYRGRRVSLADDFSSAYHWGGRQLEYSPYYPVGRMFTYQAPAAGDIWDKALAGTRLDRWLLQPIWREKDRYADLFYMIGPPIAIASIQHARMEAWKAQQEGRTEDAARLNAAAQGQLQMLGTVLRPALLRMLPAIAAANKRIEEENEKLAEAFPDLPPGHDPIEALLSQLFAPPGAPAEEAPSYDRNGQPADGSFVPSDL